jgi:GT2 family glycosyltransferase
MKPLISQDYSSMVNFARCKVAGADVIRGRNQTPFGGRVDYDYMMWIDSDIVFSNRSFKALLDMKKDIASGWYSQPGGSTPVVERMDNEYFISHGSYEFISAEGMEAMRAPFVADYIGFGWVLVRKGVFESIEYPWFAPKVRRLPGGIEDVCSEDVAFCSDARAAGFEIWVDPQVRVGHEKIQVI